MAIDFDGMYDPDRYVHAFEADETLDILPEERTAIATLEYKTCGDCGYHWEHIPAIERCQKCHSSNIQRTTVSYSDEPEVQPNWSMIEPDIPEGLAGFLRECSTDALNALLAFLGGRGNDYTTERLLSAIEREKRGR